MGLDENPEGFLIGLVGRLVEQKGIELILQTMDRYLAYSDAQFVFWERAIATTKTSFGKWLLATRAALLPTSCTAMAWRRKIYAGCDAFLMPSRFEPCGISQMIAMRYGCVPIVRRTGGLVDTVSHNDPINEAAQATALTATSR